MVSVTYIELTVSPANTVTDSAGGVLHGHNGGVWEWTETVFEGLEGYTPSKLYPGYSADFFDGKHHVVVSIMTHRKV